MDSWQINHKDFLKASTAKERIEFLLRYAILAPSTHNTQPWKFRVNSSNCEIILNEAKKLPIGDPLTRDLYISIGCCIENIVTAAEALGVDCKVLSGGQGEQCATIAFINIENPHPEVKTASLDAIKNRLNARGIFEKRKVDEGFVRKIKSYSLPELEVNLIQSREKIAKIADLTASGLEMAYADPAFRKEIASWIRPNFSKKLDGIPGYALRLNTVMSAIMPVMMRFFNIGKKLGSLNRASLLSAPVVCVLATPGEGPAEWIDVGRMAERIMLEFNKEGMRTSIFVASIEMGGLADQLKSVVSTNLKPQFLFCGGWINTPQGHTKRYNLRDMLLET